MTGPLSGEMLLPAGGLPVEVRGVTRAGDLDGDGLEDLLLHSRGGIPGGVVHVVLSTDYGAIRATLRGESGTQILGKGVGLQQDGALWTTASNMAVRVPDPLVAGERVAVDVSDARILSPKGQSTDDLVVADFTGDGVDDVLVAYFGARPRVFAGPLEGTVEHTAGFEVGGPDLVVQHATILGDLDADQQVDVGLCGAPPSRCEVFGAPLSEDQEPMASFEASSVVELAALPDVDGDTWPEVAVSIRFDPDAPEQRLGAVHLISASQLQGEIDPSAVAFRTLQGSWSGFEQQCTDGETPFSSDCSEVAVGSGLNSGAPARDLDGDGWLDLVMLAMSDDDPSRGQAHVVGGLCVAVD
ncbi:MAG: hypothetical protein KTR31_10270 [Myxococcales bacterium]|nr:hypothetical protein [Myxococcales bacterium]